jgi:signal peptidase I
MRIFHRGVKPLLQPDAAQRPGARATHPTSLALGRACDDRRRMDRKTLVRYFWREWIRPFALPLLVIMAAKSALADINPVPTGSMKPTVLEGDVVFVNKLAYDLKVPFTFLRIAHWADPKSGDVVVCFSPEDGKRLLKRVVAGPGDTLELRNETLLLNGTPVRYKALPPNPAGVGNLDSEERRTSLFAQEILAAATHAIMVTPRRPALRNFGPVTVPAESYFMLGDNRDNSHDSRFFGFVPRREIVGQATAVIASVNLNDWWKPRFDRFFAALE